MYKKEYIFDDLGHVIAGIVLCYLTIPTADCWTLVLFCLGYGALREHIQELRKHPQKEWMKYTDTIGWGIGGLVYWILKKHNKILDADNTENHYKFFSLFGK